MQRDFLLKDSGTGEILGTVVHADGSPVSRVRISAVIAREGENWEHEREQDTTDAGGTFVLRLRAGEYRVIAERSRTGICTSKSRSSPTFSASSA